VSVKLEQSLLALSLTVSQLVSVGGKRPMMVGCHFWMHPQNSGYDGWYVTSCQQCLVVILPEMLASGSGSCFRW